MNENKFFKKKSYAGGSLYLIFSSFLPSYLILSPASLALTFLILALSKMFSLFKMEKPYGAIFDVGFLVSIATLFYFPSVIFLLLAYFALATIRPFSYREWIIILMGFGSPLVILFTIYFWNDITVNLLTDMINYKSHGWLNSVTFYNWGWIYISAISITILSFLALLPSALYSSLIQVRKFTGILVLFLVLAILSMGLLESVSLQHLIFLSVPLSVFASMVLVQIKNTKVSEVVHLILILLVLAGQYLPLLNIF